MPKNITGSAGITITQHYRPIVEIRQHWWDEWTWEPDLDFTGGQVCVAADGVSEITIHRRYGLVKQPWESDYVTRSSWKINGWWVRVRFVGDGGTIRTVFVGQISTEERELHGADNGPSGLQEWTCYGPEAILEKTSIGRSFFLVPDAKSDADIPGVVKELGIAPDFNRDDDGQTGNMTLYREGEAGTEEEEDYEPGKCHLFGGTLEWSNYDIAEYLIAKFLDESDLEPEPDQFGPTWRLAGQADTLKNLYRTVDIDKTESLLTILRHLIPLDRGLDFFIRPFEDEEGELQGYEICVYSISDQEWSFGSQTIPANPNVVEFDSSVGEGTTVQIVRSAEHKYGRLRLVGERIVVCGSLVGAEARLAINPPQTVMWHSLGETPEGLAGGLLEESYTATNVWTANKLRKCWSDGLETAYKTAGGRATEMDVATNTIQADDIRELDEIRGGYKFQAVYQHFGAPDEWDMADGGWAPKFGGNGEIVRELVDGGTVTYQAIPCDYQIRIRRTLDWLPLLVGYDYSPVIDAVGFLIDTDWPAVLNDEVEKAELLPPFVLCYDSSWGTFVNVSEQYETSVKMSRNEWGFQLNVTPNHFFARNHWAEDPLTLTAPQLDWEDIIATIAIELDHRYCVDLELPGARPSDGVRDEPVHDAHLWVLAPHTILRGKRLQDTVTGEKDANVVTSGPFHRILRRDTEKMELAAAGAVSRYLAERVRAKFTARGLLPWGGLCGQLLGWINQGGDVTGVKAPITKVTWRVTQKKIETSVSAGFAR